MVEIRFVESHSLPRSPDPHAARETDGSGGGSDGRGGGSSEHMEETFLPNKKSTTIDQPGLRTQRQPRLVCSQVDREGQKAEARRCC